MSRALIVNPFIPGSKDGASLLNHRATISNEDVKLQQTRVMPVMKDAEEEYWEQLALTATEQKSRAFQVNAERSAGAMADGDSGSRPYELGGSSSISRRPMGGDDFTLRVSNLSERAREGDMRVLFAHFGMVKRVFVALTPEEEGPQVCKGFAYVTMSSRREGEEAIKGITGHVMDNLVMSVDWAQPSTSSGGSGPGTDRLQRAGSSRPFSSRR